MSSTHANPQQPEHPRQSQRQNRQHTALIVTLIVVVIAVMVGLSWALTSQQWSDEGKARSSASSSSSLSSSRSGKQKSGQSAKSGAAGKTATSDATGKAAKGEKEPKGVPLPKIGKRTGNLFAQTYKVCGPGKPFSADNTSQESLILEKDNRTLTLLSGAKSHFTLYGCVVKQLGIPDDQAQKMAARKVTKDLQTFDFNGLTAQWSYSPSGLDLYITQKQ